MYLLNIHSYQYQYNCVTTYFLRTLVIWIRLCDVTLTAFGLCHRRRGRWKYPVSFGAKICSKNRLWRSIIMSNSDGMRGDAECGRATDEKWMNYYRTGHRWESRKRREREVSLLRRRESFPRYMNEAVGPRGEWVIMELWLNANMRTIKNEKH